MSVSSNWATSLINSIIKLSTLWDSPTITFTFSSDSDHRPFYSQLRIADKGAMIHQCSWQKSMTKLVTNKLQSQRVIGDIIMHVSVLLMRDHFLELNCWSERHPASSLSLLKVTQWLGSDRWNSKINHQDVKCFSRGTFDSLLLRKGLPAVNQNLLQL